MPIKAPALLLDGRLNAVSHFILPGGGFAANAVVTVTVTDDTALAGPEDPAKRYGFGVNATRVLTGDRLLVCVDCKKPATPPRDNMTVTILATPRGGVNQTVAKVPAAVLNEPPIIDWAGVKRQTVLPYKGAPSVLFLPVASPIKENVPAVVTAPGGGSWRVLNTTQKDGRLRLKLKCTDAVPEPAPAPKPAPKPAPPALYRALLPYLLITLTMLDGSQLETPPIEIIYEPDLDENPHNPPPRRSPEAGPT